MPNLIPLPLGDVLFGPGSTFGDHLLGILFIAIGAGLLLLLGWIIVQLFRASQRSTNADHLRTFSDINSAPADPADGPIVQLTYTRYTMFLFWGEQRTISVALPQKKAELLLRNLLRHNLTRGWFGPWGVFVPFLTLVEYRSQRKSIARQAAAAFIRPPT